MSAAGEHYAGEDEEDEEDKDEEVCRVLSVHARTRMGNDCYNTTRESIVLG